MWNFSHVLPRVAGSKINSVSITVAATRDFSPRLNVQTLSINLARSWRIDFSRRRHNVRNGYISYRDANESGSTGTIRESIRLRPRANNANLKITRWNFSPAMQIPIPSFVCKKQKKKELNEKKSYRSSKTRMVNEKLMNDESWLNEKKRIFDILLMSLARNYSRLIIVKCSSGRE